MNISIIGYGKMGKIVEQIAKERNHNVLMIIDKDNASDINSEKFKQSDVAIEFSQPDTAVENFINCFEQQVPVVSGTTGWLDEKEFVENKCKEYNTAFLYAPNFSLGVNILFEMNKKLAEVMNKFNNYKPEIEETHHIHKKDAPSGTAVSIAEQIYTKIEEFDAWDFHDKAQENKIPIKSIRKGEVFGEHKISYNSNEDEIELSHKAKNRNGFALGAVLAAEFIKNKKGIYTISDMLSL